uniref:Uncharacterized protein n=1 Tax=Arundo donax TaxID=35708 RepID=A0A0A8YGA3_ARUDO
MSLYTFYSPDVRVIQLAKNATNCLKHSPVPKKKTYCFFASTNWSMAECIKKRMIPTRIEEKMTKLPLLKYLGNRSTSSTCR